MKMNKILAAGVAATLAVTSLASVVSAEERTFSMAYPSAAWSGTITVQSDIGKQWANTAVQHDMQKIAIALNSWDGENEIWENGAPWVGKFTLNVKGYKLDANGNKSSVSKEYEFDFDSDTSIASIVVLPDDEISYTKGEFAPGFFDEIESVEFNIPAAGGTTTKKGYEHLIGEGNSHPFDIGDAKVYDYNAATKTWVNETVYAPSATSPVNAGNEAKVNAEIGNNTAASILAYALTNGGYSPSKDKYMEGAISRSVSVNKNYPFIAARATGDNNTVLRQDVQLLSKTGDWNSTTTNGGVILCEGSWKKVKPVYGAEGYVYEEAKRYFDQDFDADANQSYHIDNHMGDTPNMFAGFSSQVADFFNKQTNGTITFKFATPTSGGGNDWFTGGIPSTEVGIKNFLGNASTNDFALFVNYGTTTGSLQAVTTIDAAAGTVTFDISDILDDLGGATIGTVQDIYFGLAKGATSAKFDAYIHPINADGSTDFEHWALLLDDNGKKVQYAVDGLLIEEVTIAYDEDAADDTDIEDDDATIEDDDDTTVEDDDDTTVEDDDDATIEDDDDDAAVEDDDADDADDDTDVDGDTDMVETGDDDDDANPGTGVALAVVPALVAAAAVVVSKKRK